eukprot:112907_1
MAHAPTTTLDIFNYSINSTNISIWYFKDSCTATNCAVCLSSGTTTCRWNLNDRFCYDYDDEPINNGIEYVMECPIVYISIGIGIAGFVGIFLCFMLYFVLASKAKNKKQIEKSKSSMSYLSKDNQPTHHLPAVCRSKSDVQVTYDAYTNSTSYGINHLQTVDEVELPLREHNASHDTGTDHNALYVAQSPAISPAMSSPLTIPDNEIKTMKLV